MIVSEKSHQNLSDYNQFLFKIWFTHNIKKWLFLVKKWEIQVIVTIIMLTRSLENIFNPSRYTGISFACVMNNQIRLFVFKSNHRTFTLYRNHHILTSTQTITLLPLDYNITLCWPLN